MIKEGLALIDTQGIFKRGPGKISDGFYNEEMRSSRDFTVGLLKLMGHGTAIDGMAGTGIRGIRIMKETGLKVIFNDKNRNNISIIKNNLNLNGLEADVWNFDYSYAVSKGYYDYIDLDPYGSPAGYLEVSLMHLKNHGILGVTMTDTSVLEGNFLYKGLLKYGGTGIRGVFSKEVSTRIFIAYIIRIAASLELGAKVLLSIREKHYIRVFLQFDRGVKKALNSLSQIGIIKLENKEVGPLYLGNLYDDHVLNSIKLENFSNNSLKLYENMKNEDLMVLFFVNSENGREFNIKVILDKLRERGFAAGRTNFFEKGIKTNASEIEFKEILRNL